MHLRCEAKFLQFRVADASGSFDAASHATLAIGSGDDFGSSAAGWVLKFRALWVPISTRHCTMHCSFAHHASEKKMLIPKILRDPASFSWVRSIVVEAKVLDIVIPITRHSGEAM